MRLLKPDPSWTQFDRTNSFLDGLKKAGQIWNAKFRISESGMRRPQWSPHTSKHLYAYVTPSMLVHYHNDINDHLEMHLRMGTRQLEQPCGVRLDAFKAHETLELSSSVLF